MRNPPGLPFGEELGARSPAGFMLDIDVGEFLAVSVFHDKAGVQLFDRSGLRKAAGGHESLWTVGTPYVRQVFYLCTYADYSKHD
jgi:hypothetical protein